MEAKNDGQGSSKKASKRTIKRKDKGELPLKGIKQELYTGGNDRQILVWSPPKLNSTDVDEFDRRMGQHSTVDEDNWSD
ncbi:hypothetical protein Tco_0739351 [Tanacetum coccineum]